MWRNQTSHQYQSGRFTHRGFNASGRCSGQRENVFGVHGNILLRCGVLGGAMHFGAHRGTGAYRGGRPPTACWRVYWLVRLLRPTNYRSREKSYRLRRYRYFCDNSCALSLEKGYTAGSEEAARYVTTYSVTAARETQSTAEVSLFHLRDRKLVQVATIQFQNRNRP